MQNHEISSFVTPGSLENLLPLNVMNIILNVMKFSLEMLISSKLMIFNAKPLKIVISCKNTRNPVKIPEIIVTHGSLNFVSQAMP